MTPEFWAGRRVLITGHTGFKGAWLTAWLSDMGARITGLSLEPETSPNLWAMLATRDVNSIIGDLNEPAAVNAALADAPEVVFHLAAQSLVRRSYLDPVQTFATNVTGTVALLHAISRTPSVRAVIVATSDKCYENLELERPFREGDPFGGHDPYSASKGAAEIAAASMRESYFGPGRHPAGVATVRAGNVIGGGDWSADRLIPDIVRGCLGDDGEVELRAPTSIRPWQHVLEPLHGYVMLAERLFERPAEFAEGFNLGPHREDERTVDEVANAIVCAFGKGRIVHNVDPNAPKEAKVLRLDASLIQSRTGWRPILGFDDTVALTADWYAGWAAGQNAASLTRAQTRAYMERTVSEGVI